MFLPYDDPTIAKARCTSKIGIMLLAMSSPARISIGVNSAFTSVDPDAWIDISLPVTDKPTVRAFHLPPAVFAPFRMGSFVGSIEEGGPVRCDVVSVAPHGDGTHTECVGHVGGRAYSMLDTLRSPLALAEVVTVPLTTLSDGDRVITRKTLEAAWPSCRAEALILRTLPNDQRKRTVDHSGTNPSYMHVDAMRLIDERNVLHVLIDLPSVDREEDNGALIAHKTFWHWPHAPRTDRTITELIYVPDTVQDGLYVLAFNAAPFDGDAAPSRPMIAAMA